MNTYQPRRIFSLVGVFCGALFVCGGVVFLLEFLVSGSIRVPWPEEPVTSYSGGKAWFFIGSTTVCGAGMFWSAMRELRKGTRS
jgi:hypothetical protein